MLIWMRISLVRRRIGRLLGVRCLMLVLTIFRCGVAWRRILSFVSLVGCRWKLVGLVRLGMLFV